MTVCESSTPWIKMKVISKYEKLLFIAAATLLILVTCNTIPKINLYISELCVKYLIRNVSMQYITADGS